MVPTMKITKETPDQLHITDHPWLIGAILIGLTGFIWPFASVALTLATEGIWTGLLLLIFGCGLGLAIYAAFVQRVDLTLDRVSNTMTLRTRTLFGLTRVEYDLTALSHAALDSMTGGRGGTLHRLTLILDKNTRSRPLPVTTTYSNSNKPRKTVDAINAWLAPKPS